VTAIDSTILCQSVEQVAKRAGEMLSNYFQRLGTITIEHKSSNVDLVSQADRDAEESIHRELTAIDPTIGFIGEETETTGMGESGLAWVVDPLDGTSNFLSGLPQWCVSIALCNAKLAPQLGVVHAPPLGNTWTAVLGKGAYRDGQPISVRRDPPGGGLQNTMLATGFPYDICASEDHATMDYFVQMQRRFHKIRRMGSAAIDLALVADGTFDGMWEQRLSPWDTAAGMLLVTEAGGSVVRFDGTPYRPGDPDMLVAATDELLTEIQAVLSGTTTGQIS